MPGIALRLFTVIAARVFSSARKIGWCERSPSSASATAYCIGTVLQRRPSAIFLIAASALSRRGERPMPIQPVRHPGARYAFDRLENVMIAASGSSLPIGSIGPSYPRSPYTSSARITRLWRSANSSSSRRVDVGYVAPVGLLGSMMTSARVFGVTRLFR